jgi:hypothetical protein
MILLASLALGEAVLAKTVYGRQVYAVGSNATVSRLSGLPVGWIVASTYAVSGLCVGIAGGLAASQLSTAQALMEPTIVYDVLAAVVIGGTSLSGGTGRCGGRRSDWRSSRRSRTGSPWWASIPFIRESSKASSSSSLWPSMAGRVGPRSFAAASSGLVRCNWKIQNR